MTDEDYKRLNPPDAQMMLTDNGMYIKVLDDPKWLFMGWVPTPRTDFDWFIYHIMHGLLMRYPLWDVLVWSWRNYRLEQIH